MKGYKVSITDQIIMIAHNGEVRTGNDTDDSGEKITLDSARFFADVLFSAMGKK